MTHVGVVNDAVGHPNSELESVIVQQESGTVVGHH
jgi:hypothetical protein